MIIDNIKRCLFIYSFVLIGLGGLAFTADAGILPVKPVAYVTEFDAKDSDSIDINDLINALKPRDGFTNTRGLSLETLQKEEPEPAPAPPPKISLRIHFKLNSSRLDDQSKYLLFKVSEAIKSNDLNGYQFILEGHTDTTGPKRYNQKLSEKRALSAMNYLKRILKIDQNQLSARGYGEDKLLDPYNGPSSLNRRVEIVNVGKL